MGVTNEKREQHMRKSISLEVPDSALKEAEGVKMGFILDSNGKQMTVHVIQRPYTK